MSYQIKVGYHSDFVVPQEYAEQLYWKIGDDINFSLTKDGIRLTKVNLRTEHSRKLRTSRRIILPPFCRKTYYITLHTIIEVEVYQKDSLLVRKIESSPSQTSIQPIHLYPKSFSIQEALDLLKKGTFMTCPYGDYELYKINEKEELMGYHTTLGIWMIVPLTIKMIRSPWFLSTDIPLC
jgi:bifunctional DNA-binding transcriptional regulator/antitoxin component of YhaV-PrlF toxin-antitoxin module